jgi:hypothetical protein
MTESSSPPALDPAFGRLGREIGRFANHTHKYLRASQTHRAQLVAAAEWSVGAAPLERAPARPALALRAVDRWAQAHGENRAQVFGAYFAHHHLRTQAELSRALLRASLEPDRVARAELFSSLYLRAEKTRRSWVAALLERSLAVAAPELRPRDFVALNVGALTDHEDVDLALVATSAEAKELLTRSLGAMSKVFLRFGSKLQLFLAEQLPGASAGALLEEYEALFQQPSRDVVSIMQLLGAQHLTGNRRLGRALEHRIGRRFFAGEGEPRAHETFLRAVMAELRHHLAASVRPGLLSPKREVYLPAKLALTAMRVILGVFEPLPPLALLGVIERDPELAVTHRELCDVFVENELLRALLFNYVVQADTFDLTDEKIASASRRVLRLLGLGGAGEPRPAVRLATHAAQLRDRAMEALAALSPRIERHLARVSTFRRIVDHDPTLRDPAYNLAIYLLDALERYRGSVFWDEVGAFLAEDPAGTQRFLTDLMRLPPTPRAAVAARYLALLGEDAGSLLELLILLARASSAAPEVPALFWSALLELAETDPDFLANLVLRLDAETSGDLFVRLARSYPPEHLARLAERIEAVERSHRGARVARALRAAMVLEHFTSRGLQRVLRRVEQRTPAFLAHLGDPRRQRELAAEAVSHARLARDPGAALELLGDAFDLATLRGALLSIVEAAPVERDQELVAALDDHVRALFEAGVDAASRQAEEGALERAELRVALYATGGHGRGEAFGADWDYLAVTDDDDPARQALLGRVLERVSAGLTRRGLHPHNRLAAHFGRYVVTLDVLRRYFEDRGPETFIDEAELLEARLVLGHDEVARGLEETLRRPLLEDRREPFLADLLTELADRRSALPDGLHLKLGAGGLRELQLVGLGVRVRAGLAGPFAPRTLAEAQAALPEVRRELRFLVKAHGELRRARALYRLMVAYDDQVDPAALRRAADALLTLAGVGLDRTELTRLAKRMRAVAARVDRVAEALARPRGT